MNKIIYLVLYIIQEEEEEQNISVCRHKDEVNVFIFHKNYKYNFKKKK
jgi:hypothetical protein